MRNNPKQIMSKHFRDTNPLTKHIAPIVIEQTTLFLHSKHRDDEDKREDTHDQNSLTNLL